MNTVHGSALAVSRTPLARVFDDALVSAGAGADVGERVRAFVDLARRYQQPGRYYHTLRHVAEATAALRVLVTAERQASDAKLAPACILAVYFHDAVYDPDLADNEGRSAELAVRVLRDLDCPPEIGDTVARLVLATASHGSGAPGSSGRGEALVNDADLRTLARGPAAYDLYVRRVRREYGAVDEGRWRVGRAQVLRRLLDGPLYSTGWARRRWEPSARLNLGRELDALTTRAPGAPRSDIISGSDVRRGSRTIHGSEAV
ncbi:Metal-dependent phosphohydrolase [Frankia sp. AiPs1]